MTRTLTPAAGRAMQQGYTWGWETQEAWAKIYLQKKWSILCRYFFIENIWKEKRILLSLWIRSS